MNLKKKKKKDEICGKKGKIRVKGNDLVRK